ncbi:hypothetical protein SLEP1_g19303 [Rubroshorea leprosula]|nr:hypothetical protein SLEP1_g19303 [Rubroshorea leprosula]
MQSFQSSAESPFPIMGTQIINSSSSPSSLRGLYGWLFDCHGVWNNLVLLVSSLLFVLYLVFQGKKSLQKLSHARSSIMIAYYVCLWVISLLNLAWCSLQVCGGLNFVSLVFPIFEFLGSIYSFVRGAKIFAC